MPDSQEFVCVRLMKLSEKKANLHFITNHIEQLPVCLINFPLIAECTFNLFDVLKLFL